MNKKEFNEVVERFSSELDLFLSTSETYKGYHADKNKLAAIKTEIEKLTETEKEEHDKGNYLNEIKVNKQIQELQYALQYVENDLSKYRLPLFSGYNDEDPRISLEVQKIVDSKINELHETLKRKVYESLSSTIDQLNSDIQEIDTLVSKCNGVCRNKGIYDRTFHYAPSIISLPPEIRSLIILYGLNK